MIKKLKNWGLYLIPLTIILLLLTLWLKPSTSSTPPLEWSPTVDSDFNYTNAIKPILDKRCVVCHGCYDAPCQLKLGSFEGIARGAHKSSVYDRNRLTAVDPTRLFEDAQTVHEWREKGFFPVLSQTTPSSSNEKLDNVLVNVLTQKRQHPLPTDDQLPDDFEFDLSRQLQCPTSDEYSRYATQHPLWGMPYALPGISDTEHNTILDWLERGSPIAPQTDLPENILNQIAQWENYFNRASNKGKLVSRYLFEHLFIANLYFSDISGTNRPDKFFRLVRSATPPGQPVKLIATRRPFDSPGVSEVYYRIITVQETVVDKLHLPFALNQQRQDKWNKWFYEPDYTVSELPSYEPKVASNPFITFAALPTKSRYRFMLDESQYSIMQFIKGAVCRGQVALNVINDHFWVVFADPDLNLPEYDDVFMRQARDTILLPAEAKSNALPTNWLIYAKAERDYVKLKEAYIQEHVEGILPINLDLLWDGDNENDNLALTIFRHFDAASVVKGLVGERPQTAWVITYPLFERIHYLLVAGYDVYGNVGHQLNSRMYMDFLRMEGEFNFLSLLPSEIRKETREHWYRGSVSEVEKYVYQGNDHVPETDIAFTSDNPLSELYAMIKAKVKGIESARHQLPADMSVELLDAFKQINNTVGTAASLLPQSSLVLLVDDENTKTIHTLLSHNAYTNISHLFNETERRLPLEDTVTFAPGIMTSHPNAIFVITHKELPAFARAVSSLSTQSQYESLLSNWGIRRTHPDFWSWSDILHETYHQTFPVEFGYFDYNRLENR